MEKNIFDKFLKRNLKNSFLAFSAGLLLASCGSYMNGYSETDGVYYDPSRDTVPQGTYKGYAGNRVDENYDYSARPETEEDIARYGRKGYRRNWNEKKSDSDWGEYAGSETQYSGWGSAYAPWYGSFGYGWGHPYYGGRFGMSFGWGSPWYSGYYGYGVNPYWYGDPFYGGFYGYRPYYYSPYYYSPYYGPYYYDYYGYGVPYRYSVPRRNVGPNSYPTAGNNGRSSSASQPAYSGRDAGFRTSYPQGQRPYSGADRSRSDGMGNRSIYRETPSQQRSDTYRDNSYRSSGSYQTSGYNGNYGGGSTGGSRTGGFRTGGSR